MKVIGYIRVSTAEQATGGVSLDAQRAKLEAYASLYELELVEVIVGSTGESAKSLKRPALQRALAMLKNGQADGLVIAKLDRLSRSVKDWNTLIDLYFGERPGKKLFSVSDSIDTRTAAGRLVLNVLMSVAQWEREAIGERTREALSYKAVKGERISGRCPYGWQFGADGKLLKDVPEQAVLARIRELRAAGLTLRAIADKLNDDRIPTKLGGPWKHQTVASVLNRKAA